jgi:DNA-binding MarR family transcriptional regulator
VSPTRPDAERLAVWRSFLEAHAAITAKLGAELAAQRSLSLNWYEILLRLNESGGRLRMQELAATLLVNKSSLTRQIDRLEEEGLVQRERDAHDGRGQFAVITSKGRDELRRAAPVHLRGVQKHFAAHLTDSDVVALARAFAKLPGVTPRS